LGCTHFTQHLTFKQRDPCSYDVNTNTKYSKSTEVCIVPPVLLDVEDVSTSHVTRNGITFTYYLLLLINSLKIGFMMLSKWYENGI